MDENYQVLSQSTIPTNAQEGYKKVYDRVVEEIKTIATPFQNETCIGIGVGCPGPLDYKTGTILSPPNLPGWNKIPLKKQLKEDFHLPVWVDNDANLAALAEWKFGAGIGTQHMLFITVSTGIGAGIVLNGELFHGFSGNAGEVGQMIINFNGGKGEPKSLESISSGTAIQIEAFNLLGDRISAKEVAEKALLEVESKEILSKAFTHLGLGIANLMFVLNPERIVIGGGLSSLNERILEPIRNVVDEHVPLSIRQNVEMKPAQLGNLAGAKGAAFYPFFRVVQ